MQLRKERYEIGLLRFVGFSLSSLCIKESYIQELTLKYVLVWLPQGLRLFKFDIEHKAAPGYNRFTFKRKMK